MSNYVKSTNFTSKDSLAVGNPLKIVKGSEIDTEFNNIATAVATKADTVGATLTNVTLTGTTAAPTASYGNSSTTLATTAFVQAALQALYPVGSIYSSTVSTNPNTLFGFGTWVAYAAGRVLVGQNGTTFTAGATGGSADATLVGHAHSVTGTTNVAGNHNHSTQWVNYSGGGGSGLTDPVNPNTGDYYIPTTYAGDHSHTVTGTTDTQGNSATNANLQPYVVVYMWTRTA
jgi:hypothetical protein